MKKYSPFLKKLVIAGLISAGSVSATYAQSPVQDGAGVQPPSQTLFQEQTAAPSPAPSLADSNATGGQKGETILNSAPTLSVTDTAAAPAASEKPPASLSTYINQENSAPAVEEKAPKSADVSETASSTSAEPQIPGVDPNAPGLNLTNELSADAQKESEAAQKRKDDAELRRQAFKAATDQAMPLKPSEIRRIMEMYDETAQAVETPIYPTPEPESAFQTISLDPGTKPLVVKTAIGNVTTLSIVDVTGQPWPIQDLTWAGDFQIEQPEKGSHMLRITPTSEFASGNISMRLLGLNPPVIFSLKAERKSVHVRLDVQIPEIGPKGVVPPVETPITTKAGDDFMTSVLMGVPAGTNVVKLQVDGIDGRTSAYKNGGTMYVRTPYTMLSPAWLKSVQSADGMKVYSLNYTPVVLLSDKGKMVRAYLSYKETSNEQY